ncbi:MAG: glycoside hydrolase family 5 protein [Lachnospiraceae bacterium]|nr:glycoside hydrolase family 5 protein [Lachnospiraceae bacterium]
MRGVFAVGLSIILSLGLMGCAGGNTQSSSKASQPETTSSPSQGSSEASSAEPTTPDKGLKVVGTQLCDLNGNPVQLKGISTHGLAWFPQYVNEACVKELKGWGANVFRLAMYTEENGGYCSGGNKEELKGLIRKGVSFATTNDMYVIIDWHVLNEGDPNRHVAEAKEFFAEMSKEYASNPNVLYEICNEPCNGANWNQITAYANEVIPVIRANSPDSVIIVGTPNWSQEVDKAAAKPLSFQNVMYTLHFYAATHKEDLRNRMTQAIDSGLPVFVSEFGICDASGNGAIDEDSANKWVETMNRYKVSYVCWNLSNKAESSALISSGCSKTSGFADSDLSQEGKWLKNVLGAK